MRLKIAKFLIPLFYLNASVLFAVTPAGTDIIDLAKANYRMVVGKDIFGSAESNEVKVCVSQIYGIDLKTNEVNTFSTLKGVETVCYYPCMIENKGNGRDEVKFTIGEKTEGLDVKLIRDDNQDGIPKANEDQEISGNRIFIEKDQSFKFFIALEIGDTVKEGPYSVKLRINTTSDGGRYEGDNNNFYGEVDERDITNEINVVKDESHVDLLLDLKVSNKVAYPGDILTYTITYKNIGENSAEGVIIENELPDEIRFIDASPSPNPDIDRKVIWEKDENGCPISLSPGEIGKVTIKGEVGTDVLEGKLEDVATLLCYIPERYSLALKAKTLSTILRASPNLRSVVVYPNPFKEKYSKSGEKVRFFNLTKRCRIEIYNISGELVFTYDKDDLTNIYDWELKNNWGEGVASGIYIYYLTNPESSGDKAVGKLSIIR
ncbi:MAG: T9SS type A sorting domain-containing protein [bacterium]|nr:T9SS type A sorting domain-containing protein [bacterium]